MRSNRLLLLLALLSYQLAACSSSPTAGSTATCANGLVEAGEGCDDGNATGGDGCSASCSVEAGFSCAGAPSSCTLIISAACGDGVRAAGEQCDDGNLVNLDGCDGACRFEQVLRASALAIAFDTSATCIANAFGGAVTDQSAQQAVNGALGAPVLSGALGLMLQLRDLDDLSGASDPSLEVGVFGGGVYPAASFDNGAQRDTWFSAAAGSTDAARLPLRRLAASATGGVTVAGPGRIDLPFSVFSPVRPLALAAARVRFTASGLSTPAVAAAASSPGHLATEHLDGALRSFDTATAGEICGGILASSLASLPLDLQFQSLCGYVAGGSFLDLLVSGCSNRGTISVPTQPDGVDASAPVLGAGGPYRLVAGGGKSVTACEDRLGAAVDLAGCLAAATYSGRFTFAADRVIVRPACGDGMPQAGEACDDGNTTANDGCSGICAVEVGWTCAGTPSVCSPFCGDGIPAGAEGCDDGNLLSGDGCDDTCQVEHGFDCFDRPSLCASTCGDGLLAGPEACDDGNRFLGDGCDDLCQLEPGFACAGEPSICARDGSCNVAADCGTVTECQAHTCVANRCGVAFAPAGTDLTAQVSGDCKQLRCDGAGQVVTANLDSDLPSDDGNQCTTQACAAGVPTYPPAQAGTNCSQAGGTLCNGSGACVPPACGSSAACDDGRICNGVETCDLLLGCQPGTPVACGDADPCNGVETCNDAAGCQAGTPLPCDDGDACNGVETCDLGVGCQVGPVPNCDDGSACTVDSCAWAAGCTHTPVEALVYAVDDTGKLLAIDPSSYGTGTPVREVGVPACTPGTPIPGMPPPAVPYALSVNRAQTARVLYSSGQLFDVSTVNASCVPTAFQPGQQVGGTTWQLFGMAHASVTAGSDFDRLWIAGGSASGLDGDLGSIDAGTLAVSSVGRLPAGPWPQLMGLADGTLWGFFPGPPARVQEVNRATGNVIGTAINITLSGTEVAWAAAPFAGKFWIFTTMMDAFGNTNSMVRSVHRASGQVTIVVQNQSRIIVAAGTSTCAPQ